jgi:hypothetical protein
MKSNKDFSMTVVLATFILASLVNACSAPQRANGSGLRALPNEGFSTPDSSSELYINLIAFFEGTGLDVIPDASHLSLSWPLSSEKVLLTRFGTPTLLLTALGGGAAVKMAYFHEALDIRRLNETESDEVRAPVSGAATIVYDGDPSGKDVPDYSVSVAIYDPASHLVVSLLHVHPIDSLKAGHLKNVQKGDLIGHLAPVDSMKREFEKNFRHTHLSLVDVHHKKLINPLTNFPEYKDTTRPTIKDIYITDEAGHRSDSVRTGALDIVADIFDRDDASKRNFEITSLAFKIADDRGIILKTIQKCDLNVFTEKSLATSSSQAINSLLDLGGAVAQATDTEWVDMKTDAANPGRSFRYALTNIKTGPSGCDVTADADGTIAVADDVKYIDVSVTAGDQNGNFSETTKRIERSAP